MAHKKVPPLTQDAIPVSRKFGVKYGICGALLIQQLHFLMHTNGVVRDGKVWHFKTYREWAEDIGMYGVAAIRPALLNLTKSGAVFVGNYNQKGYDKTKWYSLNYAVLGSVEDWRIIKGEMTNPDTIYNTPLISFITPPSVINHITYTGDINTEIKDKEKAAVPLALLSPLKQIPAGIDYPDGITMQESDMGKEPTSSATLLKQFAANKAGVPMVKANSASSLAHLWRTLVPKHFPAVGMVSELQPKTRGMLGHLVKRYGEQSDTIVAYTIREWIGYSIYTEAQAGLKNSPNVPDVAFLLKFADAARNYYASKHPPKKVVQTIAQKVVAKSQVVAEVKEPEYQAASIADILAWKPKAKEKL